ncbi:MAG TPA: hypothetical protein VJ020_03600 [Anaerolineales bacterium]|nr:hypothetical protein [Anaerolineales bacterium]
MAKLESQLRLAEFAVALSLASGRPVEWVSVVPCLACGWPKH